MLYGTTLLIEVGSMTILMFNLSKVDMCHGIVAIEDLGDLFESRALQTVSECKWRHSSVQYSSTLVSGKTKYTKTNSRQIQIV